MTAKEWLNRGWELNKKIDKLIEKQAMAYQRACKVTPTLVQDKVQASGGKSREDWIITRMEYEEEINSKIDELYQIKCEILRVISQINNNTYKKLLEERYANFKTWGQIAKLLNKDKNIVKTNLHRSALRAATQYIV